MRVLSPSTQDGEKEGGERARGKRKKGFKA